MEYLNKEFIDNVEVIEHKMVLRRNVDTLGQFENMFRNAITDLCQVLRNV